MQAFRNVYVGGVGSLPGGSDNLLNLPGAISGTGGRARINAMYDELVKNFRAGRKGIVIVGFSRGAALSREFAHVIQERGDPLKYREGQKPPGQGTRHPVHGAVRYRLRLRLSRRQEGSGVSESPFPPMSGLSLMRPPALRKETRLTCGPFTSTRDTSTRRPATISRGNFPRGKTVQGGS